MIDSMSYRIDRAGPMATGWLVSCLLHGSLAVAAILFVQRMELARQPEPFTWNVTMVEPSPIDAPPTRETAVLPTRTKTTPAPALQRSHPVPPTADPTPEPPQANVETPAPPIQSPVAPVSEKPEPAPLLAATLPQPSEELPSQQPLSEQTEPAHETAREPNLHPLIPIIRSKTSQPAIRQPEEPEPPSLSAPASLHGAESAPSAQLMETLSAVPLDDPPSIAPAVPSPKFKAPPKPVATVPAEPMPPVSDNFAPAHSAPPATPQRASVAEPQLAAVAPAAQLKNAKPDYGWLSDLMSRWIEDLDKRYPAILRTEGIQGKVTLTALLHEDGVLRDVRVAKSSGNVRLDQVALEDVKKGAPLTLSRPLERPRIPVKFSIIYDLKTDR